MRCDVNVSVAPVGAPPGTRCEVKNLNSVKFMMAAISVSRSHAVLFTISDSSTELRSARSSSTDRTTDEPHRCFGIRSSTTAAECPTGDAWL